MNICGYYPESINEGHGLRAVIFISGCKHACKGCFSQKTWDFSAGEPLDTLKQMELIEDMKSNGLLQGVTFCGGDPFFSAKELLPFVKLIKEHLPHLDIWSYTGFTFENLLKQSDMFNLLQCLDMIIDGRFIEETKDLTLLFRGSSNQRIIDVQSSLTLNKVIELTE